MKEKVYRLTQSELNRIVDEAAKRVLSQMYGFSGSQCHYQPDCHGADASRNAYAGMDNWWYGHYDTEAPQYDYAAMENWRYGNCCY